MRGLDLRARANGEGRTRGRRPPLNEVGTEPDYRFSLANERTFLAWNRTALALLAAGLAVANLLPRFGFPHTRLIVSLVLIGLGAGLAFLSYPAWEAKERAMREGRPLPSFRAPRVVAIGVGLVSILAAVGIVIHRGT
jgi:putative membrane protein